MHLGSRGEIKRMTAARDRIETHRPHQCASCNRDLARITANLTWVGAVPPI